MKKLFTHLLSPWLIGCLTIGLLGTAPAERVQAAQERVIWKNTISADFNGEAQLTPLANGSYLESLPGYDDPAVNSFTVTKWTKPGVREWSYIHRDFPELITPTAVKPTPDGGYLVSAYYFDHDSQNLEGYLVKLNGSGQKIWSHVFGGENDQIAEAPVQLTDGGVLLAINNDSTVVRLDADGDEIWRKHISAQPYLTDFEGVERVAALEETSDGRILAVMNLHYGGMVFPFPHVLLLDPEGHVVDHQRFDFSDYADYGNAALSRTKDGFLLTAEHYQSTGSLLTAVYEADGTPSSMRIYDLPDLSIRHAHPTSDGGLLLVGDQPLDSDEQSVSVALKLDESGSREWNVPFSDRPFSLYPSFVQETGDDEYIITGSRFLLDSETLSLEQVKIGRDANTISVRIDGAYQAYEQPPVLQNNRTLLPLRGIFEALGADVTWHAATSSVTAVRGTQTVELTLGSTTATVNGQPIQLDVAPQLINSRTMVPARFVSESLGAQVGWEADTRTVVITTK